MKEDVDTKEWAWWRHRRLAAMEENVFIFVYFQRCAILTTKWRWNQGGMVFVAV
jgi:hypothetical protein